MTWSPTRVDAHLNGDCDASTCPLCELERENEYTVPCDAAGCDELTTDPHTCGHGPTLCDDCYESLACHHCAREALNEASGR